MTYLQLITKLNDLWIFGFTKVENSQLWDLDNFHSFYSYCRLHDKKEGNIYKIELNWYKYYFYFSNINKNKTFIGCIYKNKIKKNILL